MLLIVLLKNFSSASLFASSNLFSNETKFEFSSSACPCIRNYDKNTIFFLFLLRFIKFKSEKNFVIGGNCLKEFFREFKVVLQFEGEGKKPFNYESRFIDLLSARKISIKNILAYRLTRECKSFFFHVTLDDSSRSTIRWSNLRKKLGMESIEGCTSNQ